MPNIIGPQIMLREYQQEDLERFKEEGRLRQGYYIRGQYHDKIIMGILKSEYEADSSRP